MTSGSNSGGTARRYEDDVFTKDVEKGVTLGDPDGEARYVESLGLKVPTFVDPREDLNLGKANLRGVIPLDYHVPFQMRGPYKLSDLPEDWAGVVSQFSRTTSDGFIICEGTSEAGYRRATDKEKAETGRSKIWESERPCNARAVNRSSYCAMHGGALHPADKKISDKTIAADRVPDRISRLTKVQKVLQGFIKVEELSEEEIQGSFVIDDDGTKKYSRFLGPKIEQAMTKELHFRLNSYLREKAPGMLKVITDIAENPIAEESDRFQAAKWVFERVGGKTPDVVVHGKTEAPYEQILGGIQSGSREDYRKSIASNRGPGEITQPEMEDVSPDDGNTIDAELVGDGDDERRVASFDEEFTGDDYGDSSFHGGYEDDSLDLSQVDFDSNVLVGEQSSNRHDAATWNLRPRRNSAGDDDVQHENGQRSMDGNGESSASSESEDSRLSDDDQRRLAGIKDSIAQRAELSEAAKSLKAARDRVRKRRFAAKANGSSSLDRQPYTVEFRPIMSGPLLGCHKVLIWKADQLNDRILNRIAKDQYEFEIGEVAERQARVLDREVAQACDKLAGEDVGRIRNNGW